MENWRMVNRKRMSRRKFVAGGASVMTGAVAISRMEQADGFQSPNGRPTIGVIGCGLRWDKRVMVANANYGLGKQFPRFGDVVAVCDVDRNRLERAGEIVKGWSNRSPMQCSDYRKIIDDKSIDVVHIVTPDHWHAKVAIEAMLAGKDVYCEKPMTLTIHEGQLIREVQQRTGAVFQVGTQQRSSKQFIKAVALIRDGRLGTIKKVVCGIDSSPESPRLKAVEPPKNLDWERWLGPAPKSQYRFQTGANNIMKEWSNGHYEFRWWYDFSGGKLTDWGAHHVDIATWGMGKTDTGPVKVDPVMVEHPVEFQNGQPVRNDCYNTATKFLITATYADGMQLDIRHDTDNGILFEGTKGRIFVNRGRLTGKPVEELADKPLPDGALESVYKGQPLTDHVENFFSSLARRGEPVSDVASHHRALTTCHLAGIAARLGESVKWDPNKEKVIGNPEAQALVQRPKRAGYKIEM
jgi:predicted dehydrogenase